MEFGDLEFVAFRANGALCAENPHVAGARQGADSFHRGANHTEHAPIGGQAGEILLLNGAERFGRRGVASQNDEFAAPREEFLYRLEGVAIHHVEGARTVGGTCIVAEVEVVVVGQSVADLSQNRQATVAGIKNADHGLSEIKGKSACRTRIIVR